MSLLRSLWWLLLGTATSATLSACGAHIHLSPNYGQANESWMREQQISSKPEVGSPLGLDSEETAAILKGYKKGLGGVDEGPNSPSRMMLLQDTKETPK